MSESPPFTSLNKGCGIDITFGHLKGIEPPTKLRGVNQGLELTNFLW